MMTATLDRTVLAPPHIPGATFTGLADGAHTLQARARDAAGNADPTPAAFTWTVDATPPDAAAAMTDDGVLVVALYLAVAAVAVSYTTR